MGGYDLEVLIVTSIVSSLVGGGLGGYIMRLIMKSEAKEALKPDLEKIEEDIARIERNYVTCAVCQATHSSVNTTLGDMNRKLDMLLEYQLKKNA